MPPLLGELLLKQLEPMIAASIRLFVVCALVLSVAVLVVTAAVIAVNLIAAWSEARTVKPGDARQERRNAPARRGPKRPFPAARAGPAPTGAARLRLFNLRPDSRFFARQAPLDLIHRRLHGGPESR